MRRTRFAAGHFYHFYNRGVDSAPIFYTATNWTYFLERLHRYVSPPNAEIIAYCLMPTHYHLLVLLYCDNPGDAMMHALSVSYAKAINKQQARHGPLFEGPFHRQIR